MSIDIFLIDDHAVVRDGLRLLLATQHDINVVGDAANGRDAIQAITQLCQAGQCPNIALVDIAMPGLSGIETLYQLNDVCPSVKSIILSMYSTSEHVFRALQVGALGYLLKESAGIEVIEAVRAVNDGRLYVSKKISDILVTDYVNSRTGSDAPPGPLDSLSEREREILTLVVEGKSSAEIGDLLALSPKTVDTYRSRLMSKLHISDLPSLVKFAIQHGLTSLD